jgi:hypothetical protein
MQRRHRGAGDEMRRDAEILHAELLKHLLFGKSRPEMEAKTRLEVSEI